MNQFKPIAMRCNQEQFDAVKPKLKDFNLLHIEDFKDQCYLVNNYCNIMGEITNLRTPGVIYDRTVFETWDEKVFLEYCGITSVTLDDAYIVECKTEKETRKVANHIKNYEDNWSYYNYVINHKGLLSNNHKDSNNKNTIPEQCEHLPVISFQEWEELFNEQQLPEKWCIEVTKENYSLIHKWRDYTGCETSIGGFVHDSKIWFDKPLERLITTEQFKTFLKTQKQTEMKDYIITSEQAQELIAAACPSDWQPKLIANWSAQIALKQDIRVSQEYLNLMRNASNSSQKDLLDKHFGKDTPVIDYDKLKTGSIVKIKHTGEHCGGITEIDKNKPVNVVFYNTPHYIRNDKTFKKRGNYSSHCTFEQNGNFVLFSADKNVDYITEVISY